MSRRIALAVLLLGILVVGLGFMALRPVPAPADATLTSVRGTVETVESPCCRDIEIRLAGDDRRFHVNRGLERDLELDVLRDRLIGRVVDLEVIDHAWTPLDPMHRVAPVARIEVDGEVLLSVGD